MPRSVTSYLTFRYGTNPTQAQIDSDSNDSDDPEHLAIVFAVVAEDDGEDDAAKVSRCTSDTGNDTYRNVSILMRKT